MSSSYRSSRLGLSHWDPYAMHRGGCLELYYCNMVEWSWLDSSLIWKTNWFPSVLWHCWFGHMTCKNRPGYDLYCVWWDVKPCSINLMCICAQIVDLAMLMIGCGWQFWQLHYECYFGCVHSTAYAFHSRQWSVWSQLWLVLISEKIITIDIDKNGINSLIRITNSTSFV